MAVHSRVFVIAHGGAVNIEAIRILAADADVAIDGPMLKFAELVIERCAVVAERCNDGETIAARIRDFFELDDESVDPSPHGG